ncbi:DUF7146 domain-containing protein [Roseibium sp.]|uniref:DUF7146 domain-containing protein n=1 Tax=Roseibium sp. TaxID=1936156 RepID=UPI003B52A1A0
MTRHDDTELIVGQLKDRIEQLLDQYNPGWVNHKGKAYLAPKSPKALGSFQVHLSGSHRGDWYRHSQGFGGGPVSLLAYLLNGCTSEPSKSDLANAFKEARVFLGMDQGQVDQDAARRAQERRQREQAQHAAKEAKARVYREELAADLWQHATRPEETPAEVYFKNRVKGWDGFHTDQIRFHPEAFYTKDLKLPCIVCQVTGPDGNPVGVWRIYLNEDGTNYRDETGKKVKKGLGPCMELGGAIRLQPVTDGTIGACEGVESGYGAWNLAAREIPIWPMMATSGMVNFQKPFGVSRVVGFPDGDRDFDAKKQTFREPPGFKAWRSLEERMRAEQVATGTFPTMANGTDPLEVWNELYEKHGAIAA